MIDLHCHILPNLDDGPTSLEESIEMCRLASADGIHTIVATPHFKPGIYNPLEHDLLRTLGSLQEEVRKRNLSIRLLCGADISITPELWIYLQEKRLLTINGTGRYFLAEFSHATIPQNWDWFLLQKRRFGIIPILTHPERNRWFLSHPEALYSFVLSGGLVQLTASSLLGQSSDDSRDFALRAIKYRHAHIIATDAHSVKDRPPRLAEAVDVAAKIVGKDSALDMVNTFPQKILLGTAFDVPNPVPIEYKKKTWFQRLANI